MRGCECADWNENVDKMLMTRYLHAHGIVYDGVMMRYCPWCSMVLTNTSLRDWLKQFELMPGETRR